jgi:hypothetical protein
MDLRHARWRRKKPMKTSDYGIFKDISGNRKINENHVKNLIQAIERRNLLPYFPVLVNEKNEVIDGQHRLTAAMRLNQPVYYEKVSGLRIEDVMQINISSKSWGMMDFINSWIELDKPDYVKLKNFIDTYGFNPSVAASILKGVNGFSGASGDISKEIKWGKFKVASTEYAEKIALFIKKLEKYSDFPVNRDRELIRAIMYLNANPSFDFDRLEAKLRMHNLELEKRPSTKYYLLHIEEIYNWHTGQAGKVELYVSTSERFVNR